MTKGAEPGPRAVAQLHGGSGGGGVLAAAQWRTVLLASAGSSLEAYDFIVFGVFAREIAGEFFPRTDPNAALLSTLGVLAVGFLARPLGGILLGSLGDRFGRRILLLISVLSMSAATIGIALLPGYRAIGILAPISLVILRLAQGFFLAGELPCAVTYVVEEAPSRAGLAVGAVIFCTYTGVLVATGVSLAIHQTMSPEAVSSYGWRIPFGFGGIIGLLSYWLRASLQESPEFQRMRTHARQPFRELVRQFPRQVVVGIATSSVVNVSNSLLFVVLPTYLTTVLHFDLARASASQNLGIAVQSLSTLAVGWLSDRFPARFLHRAGTCLLLGGAVPLYAAIADHRLGIEFASALIGLAGGCIGGTYAYLLADQFPTRVRFSGVALSLNVSTVLFTALTPAVVTAALQTSTLVVAPGLYQAVVAALSFVAGFALRGMSGHLARTAPSASPGERAE